MPDVRDGFAQNFVRDGSHVSFAKEQEAKNVRDGVTLLPFEINMRNAPCGLFNMDQESRNGVGHNGAARMKDAVVAKCLPFDGKPLIEFRRVGALHLQKDNLGSRWKAMDRSNEVAEPIKVFRSGGLWAFEG